MARLLVSDLTEKQRAALDQYVLECMTVAVMRSIEPGFRQEMIERASRPKRLDEVASDIIRDVLGDLPKNHTDIRPSLAEEFLNAMQIKE